MTKEEQIRKWHLLYFAAININEMPEKFLGQLLELALKIEEEDQQCVEALSFYENAITDTIFELDIYPEIEV